MTTRLDVAGIGDYIRVQREAAEVSLRQLAKASGVSNPYLSQIERGLRNPSADILAQIAKALRISAESLYIQAGLLEERPGEVPTVTVGEAIEADPSLTERQREVLREIYAAFQSENAVRAAATTANPTPSDTPKRAARSRSTRSGSTT